MCTTLVQTNVNNIGMIFGCQLKKEYARYILREVARVPFEDTNFAQVVVGMGNTVELTPFPNRGSRPDRLWETQ